MSAIPTAFGALCLNEAGLKSVQESDALKRFFEIFESPAHVAAMDHETDLPNVLGCAFDELVRHHPALKPDIAKAVRDMVKQVNVRCLDWAENGYFGAKLWLNSKSGDTHEMYVAGGSAALSGISEGEVRPPKPKANKTNLDAAGDVSMVEAHGEHAQSSKKISFSEVRAQEESVDPPPSLYISVVCRFLLGFLNNSPTCAAFVEAGGLDHALELATEPTLEATYASGLDEELPGMLRLLVEQKPYLAIPSIIHTLHGALDTLEPLLSNKSDLAFFTSFTFPPDGKGDDVLHVPGPAVLERGTDYVKALVIVDRLCAALSVSFQNQHYSHRTTSTIFTQANLADLYVDLIEKLGKLHRSCVWEEVNLLKSMPKGWQDISGVSSEDSGFRPSDINEMFESLGLPIPASPPIGSTTVSTAAALQPVVESSSTQPSGEAEANTKASGVEQYSAQRENTKLLRNLLAQVPASITPLFHSLGKMLLVRRVNDAYQKQNAFKVSDQIALAVKEQLTFELPRDSTNTTDRLAYWVIILWHFSRLFMEGK
jgi:E3 ubiquitin-protein ligase HUWE1